MKPLKLGMGPTGIGGFWVLAVSLALASNLPGSENLEGSHLHVLQAVRTLRDGAGDFGWLHVLFAELPELGVGANAVDHGHRAVGGLNRRAALRGLAEVAVAATDVAGQGHVLAGGRGLGLSGGGLAGRVLGGLPSRSLGLGLLAGLLAAGDHGQESQAQEEDNWTLHDARTSIDGGV